MSDPEQRRALDAIIAGSNGVYTARDRQKAVIARVHLAFKPASRREILWRMPRKETRSDPVPRMAFVFRYVNGSYETIGSNIRAEPPMTMTSFEACKGYKSLRSGRDEIFDYFFDGSSYVQFSRLR
jgi:hypothetical protein